MDKMYIDLIYNEIEKCRAIVDVFYDELVKSNQKEMYYLCINTHNEIIQKLQELLNYIK